MSPIVDCAILRVKACPPLHRFTLTVRVTVRVTGTDRVPVRVPVYVSVTVRVTIIISLLPFRNLIDVRVTNGVRVRVRVKVRVRATNRIAEKGTGPI